MLLIVLQDICSAQSSCTNMPSIELVTYLRATSDKGLIMKPSEKLLKIDSFPDANFSGMYGHEVMDNPVCVIAELDM